MASAGVSRTQGAERPAGRAPGSAGAVAVSSSAGSLGHHRLTLENIPARAGSPFSWGDLVSTWENYVSEKENQRLVFVGDGAENRDEILTAPYAHRFRQEYTKMQYAKIQSYIRGALEEYQEPHLAILTFSTSTLKPNGEPRPPLDHLEELMGTWEAGVYYELNQVMASARKGDPWEPREEWEYLFILEPTTDRGHVGGGYAHAHVGIVVDGEVSSARFESVISRHLAEAPNATGDAHELEDAVVVKEAAELGNPGAYLFKYLGKSWDAEGMEDYEKRFAGLLFDQGRQRFRASNGAQRWMQREEAEAPEPWIFAGVASAEQADALTEFEDYQDFKIATGGGLRSWLQQKSGELEQGETYLVPDPDAEGSWEQPVHDTPFDVDELPTAPSIGAGGPPEGDRPPPAL